MKREEPERAASTGRRANGQAVYIGPEVHRKVSVKGSGGVSATMVVIVRQGKVLVSIEPPFTWEAIMEPEKVDDVIRALALARNDARRMAVVRGKQKARGGRRPVSNGTVEPGTKAGTKPEIGTDGGDIK